MRKRLILVVCGVLTLLACDRSKTAQDSIADIESMEKKLFSTMESPDDSLADALMTAYEAFNTEFKENEMAPEFLFRAANVARSFNEYDRALSCYETILADHPEYENIIETKFLIAFMYDNDFKDKDKAEELYKKMAAEYPRHLFGKEAAQRLETLHMTDQEMLEHFKRKNATVSDSVSVVE
ncbi:MAG: hypothetical protein O2867_07120 [Bacteroidetes bacterium]|jgi:tetratricopeptide (TPR) repeat protein|nr:hypothetical protein [Bacteroidota bacterium]